MLQMECRLINLTKSLLLDISVQLQLHVLETTNESSQSSFNNVRCLVSGKRSVLENMRSHEGYHVFNEYIIGYDIYGFCGEREVVIH